MPLCSGFSAGFVCVRDWGHFQRSRHAFSLKIPRLGFLLTQNLRVARCNGGAYKYIHQALHWEHQTSQFALRTAAVFLSMDSATYFGAFLWDSGHVDLSVTLMLLSVLPHRKKVLSDSHLVSNNAPIGCGIWIKIDWCGGGLKSAKKTLPAPLHLHYHGPGGLDCWHKASLDRLSVHQTWAMFVFFHSLKLSSLCGLGFVDCSLRFLSWFLSFFRCCRKTWIFASKLGGDQKCG